MRVQIGDGMHCRPSVADFPPGSRWLLALNGPGWALSHCGEFWLRLEGDQVWGRFAGDADVARTADPASAVVNVLRRLIV